MFGLGREGVGWRSERIGYEISRLKGEKEWEEG